MAGTNEILPWAQGVGANVATQAAFAAAAARTNGVTSGVADSSLYNKAQRQAAFMARVLSQWAVDQTGGNIFDNGDEATAKGLLTTSVQTIVSTLLTAAAYATIAQVNAGDANLQQQISAETQTRASQDGALQADYINRIAAEANARASAVTAEANSRYQADTYLQSLFGNYVSLSAMQFFSTPSGNGVKMPLNGGGTFVIQWGRVTLPSGQGDYIAFPTPFPSACLQIVASDWGDGVNTCAAVIQSNNTGSFRAYSKNYTGQYNAGTAFGFVAFGV